MKKDNNARPQLPALGRRDLMKIGAGVVMTSLNAPRASAQGEPARPARAAVERPVGVKTVTGAGYKNDANRVGGNGPMDGTSRKLASFVLVP